VSDENMEEQMVNTVIFPFLFFFSFCCKCTHKWNKRA